MRCAILMSSLCHLVCSFRFSTLTFCRIALTRLRLATHSSQTLVKSLQHFLISDVRAHASHLEGCLEQAHFFPFDVDMLLVDQRKQSKQ